jgi:hypothetical protein
MREILLQKYLIEICAVCNKTPQQLGVQHLELHESKYERPLNPDNFFWLCKGCNHLKPLRRSNILKTSSITAEHKKSSQFYPLFIRWLDGEINKPENNYHIPYDRVVDQAAYDIGMAIQGYPLSTETIKRNLGPLCDHPTSPYVTHADNNGQIQIYVKGYEPQDE